MKRFAVCVSCLLLSVLTAEAQTQRNWIYQLNGYCLPGVHYSIQQEQRRVDIIAGFANPSKRFKFAARTQEYQGGQWLDIGPGDIDLIQIQDGVGDPGTVIIEISGSPSYPTGGNHVKEIDLPTWHTASSELWWIRIEQDLGEDGMSDFDQIDLIHVNGDLHGSLFSQGDIGNAITIGGNLYGNIVGDEIQAVTVNGPGPHTGNIFRRHATTQSGNITISDHCSGTIDVNGSLSGPLSVGGNLSGLISLAAINSDIHIAGDLAASGRITASGGLNGEIQIDGSMFNGDPEHEIHITLTMSAQGAVAVDYDGFEEEHSWHDGATVRVGQQTYYGNDAANRVYEITCLKGDLNNDDAMDSYDIDPFVLALSDPDAYDAAYPGLMGSLHYHGDLNCDDVIDAFDVDPFVLRMVDPEQYYYEFPDCEECPAPLASGAGGGTGPEDVAALLSENVAEARLPLVIEFAQFLATHYANTPRGQFWAAVLTALE